MPLLNVKLLEGVFTLQEKQELIRQLTNTMVAIKGENMRPHTVVMLEEIKSGEWGIGGVSYHTADVKTALAGNTKR